MLFFHSGLHTSCQHGHRPSHAAVWLPEAFLHQWLLVIIFNSDGFPLPSSHVLLQEETVAKLNSENMVRSLMLNILSAFWWKSGKAGDCSCYNCSQAFCRHAGPYGNACDGMRVCIRTKSANCVIPLSRDCGGAVGACEDQSSTMYAWGRNAPSTKLPRGNYSLWLSEICCYWSISGRTLSDSLFHSLLYWSNKNRNH